MRNKRYLLSIIVAILCPTLVRAAGCADTTNIYKFRYNGKRYEIVKAMKNWDAAAACAVERGGYLAQINSQAEQDSIYFAITTSAAIPTNYTVVADGGGIAYVWIGATDKHTEGTWLWDGNNDNVGANFWNGQGTAGAGGGSAVSGAYNHWGGSTSGVANEPDNYAGSQNAAGIALASWPLGSSSPLGIGGEWNDINLTNQLYYVIEYDNATEIENLSKTDSEIDVVLYPNPAHNMLRISVGQTNPIDKVSVYEPSGKQMISSSNTSINIEALPNGLYIAVIEFKNGSIQHKSFIVN